MRNYAHYTIDDFIQDESFRDWVAGRSDQDAFWFSFPDKYPAQRTVFQQAAQLLRATHVANEPLSELAIRKETDLFIERASTYQPDRYAAGNRPAAFSRRSVVRWLTGSAVAAAVLMALMLGITGEFSTLAPTRSLRSPASPEARSLVETVNATQQSLRVVLNDGSEVILSPRSQLRYPARFARNQARIVYLKGEALFSVKRQTQPFMVYSGEMITKVLGTRFVVRAFERDRHMTVQVLSGKVSVYRSDREPVSGNNEVSGLILKVNQAALFEKRVGSLTKTLVSRPVVIGKPGQPVSFVYDEVPLPTILQELERSYDIPIQFDEQSFTTCKITADLTSESLYEKLDLLCKASSASYEITDGQIVISRKPTP